MAGQKEASPKRINSKRKGCAEENRICRELSLWWSDNERDDLFQRTASSGGKASSRTRTGKKTEGQYGDVTASTEESMLFNKVFTVEVKSGYAAASFQDSLDRIAGSKLSLVEQFIEQAEKESQQAGTQAWMLVWKRTRRKTLLLIPFRPVLGTMNWDLSSLACFQPSGSHLPLVFVYDWDQARANASIRLLAESLLIEKEKCNELDE